jgi:hypothetical protein
METKGILRSLCNKRTYKGAQDIFLEYFWFERFNSFYIRWFGRPLYFRIHWSNLGLHIFLNLNLLIYCSHKNNYYRKISDISWLASVYSWNIVKVLVAEDGNRPKNSSVQWNSLKELTEEHRDLFNEITRVTR